MSNGYPCCTEPKQYPRDWERVFSLWADSPKSWPILGTNTIKGTTFHYLLQPLSLVLELWFLLFWVVFWLNPWGLRSRCSHLCNLNTGEGDDVLPERLNQPWQNGLGVCRNPRMKSKSILRLSFLIKMSNEISIKVMSPCWLNSD